MAASFQIADNAFFRCEAELDAIPIPSSSRVRRHSGHFDAEGRPDIVRRIRDLYRALKDRGRHVLFVSPRLSIPEEAKKEIYIVEYEYENATCATLYRYPDAPPPANTRLEPEIATAMPSISADGLTYTIQIRDGFAFSLGFGCVSAATGTIVVSVRLRDRGGRIHDASGSVQVDSN